VPLRRASLFLLLALAFGARAEVIDARVTHIGDGDSLSVCLERQEARVRLLYIDAPEYRQPFGKEARRSLAELCAGKVARLAWEQKDRYDRILARVTCGEVDVNAEQVRRGLAWVSRLDRPEPAFYAAQRAARAAGLGLWSDPDPVPPWQWRRREKSDAKTGSAVRRDANDRPCAP
jgi:endonuclease YncB( thermonuclease family)